MSARRELVGFVRLAVGQRWKVGGVTYAITSMNGSDPSYPIAMHEVARSSEVARSVEAQIAGCPEHLRAHKLCLREPRSMNQERAWFERSDVALVMAAEGASK